MAIKSELWYFVVCDRCGQRHGDGVWISEDDARAAVHSDTDWRVGEGDVCLDCRIDEANEEAGDDANDRP